MTRRNNPAKWVLPTNVHPDSSLCVKIPVPDEPAYKAAFWGALLDLASGYKWDDDPAHTAKDVALVWRSIIDNLTYESCDDRCTVGGADEGILDAMIRQNPANCAQLQSSVDGINWCTFADFSGCISGQTVQPRGPGALGPSQAYDTCLTLDAKGQWLIPVPVSTGDIITVSSVTGAWSDGTLLWKCPDGTPFIAGVCVGAKGHSAGDPSATLYHMALILNINGVWYDPLSGPVTVPAGVTNVNAYFQANDVTLTDNQGSIGFCVDVLKSATPANTWQHTFDFTTGLHGFRTASANTTYVAGQGFTAGDAAIAGGYERSMYMGIDGTSIKAATYTYIEFDFSASFGTFALGGPINEFIDCPNGTPRVTQAPAAGQTNIHTPAITVANPASIFGKVTIDQNSVLANLTGFGVCTRCILRGSGTSTDPYAGY